MSSPVLSHRIIEPLTSRCTKFRFKPLSRDVAISRLEFIASQEGVRYDPGVIGCIVEVSQGDLRKAITYLQSAASLKSEEGITQDDIMEIAGVRKYLLHHYDVIITSHCLSGCSQPPGGLSAEGVFLCFIRRTGVSHLQPDS